MATRRPITDYPLVKVKFETMKDKWTRFSHLECGHEIVAPMSYTGAHPAKHRRCYKCPPRENS